MFSLAGSNVFGQWLLKQDITERFQFIPNENEEKINLKNAQIVHIGWYYNIFKAENKYYVLGAWKGYENQIIELPLPTECLETNLIVIGNDYNIIIINKKSSMMWTSNLESEEIKKINLNIETPLNMENSTKRSKKLKEIIKAAITNHSMLCLTSSGVVYMGMLPNYLDTSTCIGKVIDVQCGYEHFILLTDAGRVYTWGNGRYAICNVNYSMYEIMYLTGLPTFRRLQLGQGDLCNIDTPTEVEALSGIKIIKICAGGWHSIALSEFGDLYAWGWNDAGQLGISEDKQLVKSHVLPICVEIYDESGKEVNLNIKDIACGSRHTAILLEDNSIWTTGSNKYGQLGFSIDICERLNTFKKSLVFDNDCKLMCGPWCTVIIGLSS